MNIIIAIACLLAVVAVREAAQAISDHFKAKDAITALETIKETAENKRREAEYQAAEAKSKENAEQYRKEAAEAEIRAAEAKAALADKLAQLTPEQLEAYEKEMNPVVQTVPVPLFGPVINLTPGYNQQGIMQPWRGW